MGDYMHYTALRFPIRRTQTSNATEWKLDRYSYIALKDQYPGLDVDRELRVIRQKLLISGSKPGPRGIYRHITRELDKVYNKLNPVKWRYGG